MTTIDSSDLLLQRAYHWEKTSPEATYLTQPMGGDHIDKLSWSRVLDEARRMAAYIQAQGFEPGSNIAVLSKNCAQFIMTDLAIWMAGHTSVALYPTLNADSVQYILEHSEAKMLFVGKLDTWNEMKPGVPEGLLQVSYPLSPKNDFPTWNTIIKEQAPIEGSPVREGKDLAIIVYTSGSTGKPKGVMQSFNAMATSVRGLEKVLNSSPMDRILSYLPLAHVMERFLVESLTLRCGFQVFFAESLDTFVSDLQRAQPTLFVSVPRLWLKFQLGVFQKMPQNRLKWLLKIPVINKVIKKKILTGLGLQNVRFAGSGSAPIPGELIAWYKNLGLELLEGYGMSENFSYSHISMPGKTKVGYVGNPYPGVEQRISEEGEILVKSPSIMLGYYKQPELTAECFTEDEFLKTGDRGEIDANGTLKITGRVKELFKTSKGKYIAPAPIENIINNDSRIELSMVSGSGNPQAHAVVQLAEDIRPKLGDASVRKEVESALQSLLQKVNTSVDHHENLEFIVVSKSEWTIESGALTPTMKIKRNTLEDLYQPKWENWYDSKQKVIWED
ncbi:MAG: AMP-binding protein [Deltaproteobacteria bacterium]|jgi:long-chain acyl-CoA synthetase|nr:AMP-binding protein [Deltaproteobacteria bacterium]MBT6436151.1 AMP-binding protein [Deltaproteobacteria bacterium]MBT6489772.1 AMP-binding protein [Deltaproteobacteria bacterium]